MLALHVHKGRVDPGNFQPISIVPVAAKILENLVCNQLQFFLERNEQLNHYQGAYHHGKSIEQLLL